MSSDSGELDLLVASILAGTTDDLSVWGRISEAHQVRLLCSLFMDTNQEGIEISARTLTDLGQRGIGVVFWLYGGDDPDDEAE